MTPIASTMGGTTIHTLWMTHPATHNRTIVPSRLQTTMLMRRIAPSLSLTGCVIGSLPSTGWQAVAQSALHAHPSAVLA